MKTAYLIVCHKNPRQVARLVDQLKTGDGDIFIHMDSRMSEEACAQLRALCEDDRCRFIQSRMHGELDDGSFVHIVMRCIHQASRREAEDARHYDYYAVLSGQDYPIRPVRWIEQQLSAAYPTPILDCTRLARGNWVTRKFDMNGRLIRYRETAARTKKGLPRRVSQVICLIWRKKLRLEGRTTGQRLTRRGIAQFGGSAWWILPDALVKELYNAYEGNSEVIRLLLSETYTPEETFVQTMAMQTSFAAKIHLNAPGETDQNCKTYADFGGKSGRKLVDHPYILTCNDFDRLRSSDYWFARKFDENADREILDRIDNELLHIGAAKNEKMC